MHIPALQKVEYTEGFKCVSTSLSSEELKIDIRRNFILTDALREGHKPRFSSKKLLKVRHLLLTVIYYFIPHFILKVTFVGESGVDTGGPKREFLRLLAIEASDSSYYRAGPEGSFFSCNTTAFKVIFRHQQYA